MLNVGYLPVGKVQTSYQPPAYPAGNQIPFYLRYIRGNVKGKNKISN